MPGQSCAARGIFKRDSIYYTGPRTNHCATGRPHPATTAAAPNTQTAVSPLNTLNVDSSKCPSGSSVKKQVAWADQGNQSLNEERKPQIGKEGKAIINKEKNKLAKTENLCISIKKKWIKGRKIKASLWLAKARIQNDRGGGFGGTANWRG